MKEMSSFDHPNIRLFGYTKNVSKLMDVADLLITKPGGMTCTEAMVKGIPMLFMAPLPGQEEENCDYFVSLGYGQIIHCTDMLEHQLRCLFSNTTKRTCNRLTHNDPDVFIFNPRFCAQAVYSLLHNTKETA